MTAEKKPSRLTHALLETAEGLHIAGLMSDSASDTIALRHNAMESLRAAADIGIAALDRCAFTEFATVDALVDHLNKIATSAEDN